MEIYTEILVNCAFSSHKWSARIWIFFKKERRKEDIGLYHNSVYVNYSPEKMLTKTLDDVVKDINITTKVQLDNFQRKGNYLK